MSIIIGQKHEQTIFAKTLESKEASFIALYGRRRIGKKPTWQKTILSTKGSSFS
jgi:hypothetical protein